MKWGCINVQSTIDMAIVKEILETYEQRPSKIQVTSP